MFRDRIKSLRRVRAGDLQPNPRNWRTHSDKQRAALQGILEEVGFADALLVREVGESLQIIDGHLRADTTPDMKVPVLVLDVDEAEADKLLAVIDPLAAMAEPDPAKLDALLREIDTGSEALQEMLADLAKDAGLYKGDLVENPEDEWQGMPEFAQEDQTAWKSIAVHFACQKDYDEFAKRIKQKLTEKTRSIWFPPAEIGTYADKRYVQS